MKKEDGVTDKILITGVGRSGTSFLVQLLTELGFDTGFKDAEDRWFSVNRAGMELDLGSFADGKGKPKEIAKRVGEAPEIIKAPFLSWFFPHMFEYGLEVELVIIPMRRYEDIKKSARKTQSFNLTAGKQGKLLHRTIWACVAYDIPILFLHFERMIDAPGYLYAKLSRYFEINRTEFDKVFIKVCKLYR